MNQDNLSSRNQVSSLETEPIASQYNKQFSKVNSKKGGRLAIFLIILSITFLLIAIFFAYNYFQLKKNQKFNEVTNSEEIAPTLNQTVQITTATLITPEPTLEQIKEDDWLSYLQETIFNQSDDGMAWKGFVLHYPPSWEIEATQDEYPKGLTVKIFKENGDYFQIMQGMGGGGRCVFLDERDYESYEDMGFKFSEYDTIKKQGNIIWRLAENPQANDIYSHQLCEQNVEQWGDEYYKDSTTIGFTSIKVTTQESLQELEQILAKLEIVD